MTKQKKKEANVEEEKKDEPKEERDDRGLEKLNDN